MRKSALARLVVGVVAIVAAAGGARADLQTSYALGPVVFPGAATPSVRQIAVNNNIGSAWYGCVFVADAGGPAATPQRRVMIFCPAAASAGTGATSYVDTGATISVPDKPGGNGAQFAPFGVFVGSDDTVWVANYDDRTVETFALPAGIPGAGSMGTTTVQINIASFDEEAKTSSNSTVAKAGSSPRAIFVNGPVTDANVFLGSYDGTTRAVQRYTVAATSASTPDAVDHIYTTFVTTSIGPYGIAADAANNAYVPLRVAAGEAAIWKLDPNGARDASFDGSLPPGYTDSAYAGISFTKDTTVQGGGYLYYSFRNGTAGNTVVLRYGMNGAYLDGFGAAGTSGIPNFTALSITGSTTQYVASDDLGNVYQRYVNGSNSAVIKINKKAPYVVEWFSTTSAYNAVHSSPTAVDGVVYFGDDNGMAYAYRTSDGFVHHGFPIDFAWATYTPFPTVEGRLSVYITSAGKGIYLITNNGAVVRMSDSASDVVSYTGHAGGAGNVGTPAVLPDGTIYAGVASASGLYVLKLNADMTLAAASPALGPATGSISSVAVNGNSVYVGLTGGTSGDIVVLKASDLTPQAAGVADGEGVTAPPFVDGISAYVGTLAGNFYKVNSITFAPDATFGAGGLGHASIGEALPGSAFNNGNDFYVGSAKGKLWKIDSLTGVFDAAYDTGDSTAVIPGLVVNPSSSTVAFGTSAGVFYQFPVGGTNAQVFRGYGPFRTTPTLDRATGRFFIGSDDKNVYAFSSR